MDSRPSELDPYPRSERDLGTAVLWERSTNRSQRRREHARRARRDAPRRKGVTIAAGAAILASPVLAPLASASSARPGVTKTEIAQKAAEAPGRADGAAVVRRHRRGGRRDAGAAAGHVRRHLRPDHRGRGQALPGAERARDDRGRRHQDLDSAVQVERHLLRREHRHVGEGVLRPVVRFLGFGRGHRRPRSLRPRRAARRDRGRGPACRLRPGTGADGLRRGACGSRVHRLGAR